MGFNRWILLEAKTIHFELTVCPLFPSLTRVPALLRRFSPALTAALAGGVVVLPAVILGVPNNNDLANHYHFAIPFYEALRHGEVYPGWLASPNFGYGDVVVRFYPPALYYLLVAGRAIASNWYAATLLVITVLSALGSLGAYFWARCFVPRNIAIWAGVFYALMPYHLSEFYQAAQLAEFAAGGALLFALGFVKRLCDQGRWRDAAGLTAAYAALILSHLPLAVFGSLTLSVYALLSLRKPKAFVSLTKLSLAVVFGLAASSFYWARMIPEMNWIIADSANTNPLLDYRQNFVFSTLSPEKQETLWWMALLAITTLMMTAPAFVVLRKSFRSTARPGLIAVAVLMIFSIFMSTALSKPVWATVPYLPSTQHPFRWLAVTSVAAPILMAASVPFWAKQFQQRQRSLALIMTGLVLIAVTFSLSQTVRGATYLSRPTFEQMLSPLKESPSIVQWLPIWASASATNRASYEKCTPPVVGSAKVETPNRQLRIIGWDDLKRVFEVEAGGAVDAHIATFYYPHWIAIANGQVLPSRPANDGTLLVSLPREHAIVNLEFREPQRTKVSVTV